ncbi:MAG: holo-ACP synthase [Planctomycetota bacterium]
MYTVAHGIDLVEVARIEALVQSHGQRFLERIFTAEERARGEGRKREAEHLAARFAAKEAVLKAIGTGWRYGIAWTDISVTNDNEGCPLVEVTGLAREYAEQRGIKSWLISLSHTETHAIASVIGLG